MTLNLNHFFSSPVEVVKVTPKNLEEVAEWCGGKVARVESRKFPGRIDTYVWVPTPEGSKISWAFPGMFITKRLAITERDEIKATYSVMRKDYFNKNYFESPAAAVDATWERNDRETKAAARAARTLTIEVPEGQDPKAALAKINAQLNDNFTEPAEVAKEEISEMVADQQVAEDNAHNLVIEREQTRSAAVELETNDPRLSIENDPTLDQA